MSLENVKSFYAKVNEDENLHNQIQGLVKGSAEESMQALVELANAHGFPFDKKDLEAFISEVTKQSNTQDELSEAELAAVAGGTPLDWVIYSIVSLGGACAGSAITKVVANKCILSE